MAIELIFENLFQRLGDKFAHSCLHGCNFTFNTKAIAYSKLSSKLSSDSHLLQSLEYSGEHRRL